MVPSAAVAAVIAEGIGAAVDAMDESLGGNIDAVKKWRALGVGALARVLRDLGGADARLEDDVEDPPVLASGEREAHALGDVTSTCGTLRPPAPVEDPLRPLAAAGRSAAGAAAPTRSG